MSSGLIFPGSELLNIVAPLFGILIGLFVTAVLFYGLLLIIRYRASANAYFEQKVFLVKLPKEKIKDGEASYTTAQMQEEISKGETLFASIGGLSAQRGLKTWLFGRRDSFSLEIAASKGKIAFYVVTPANQARYLEQQIHAHYPEASLEEVEDYNAFAPQSKVVAGFLKTKKSFVFPIKTYRQMDVDPLNSLINVMSKLNKDESIVIQYVVRSAKAQWHSHSKEVVSKIIKTNSISAGLKKEGGQKLDTFLEMASLKSSKKPEAAAAAPVATLSEVERILVKAMEEKNSKSGLDVNVRVVVSAATELQAKIYLDNISNAFSEYNNYSYGNNFSRLSRGNDRTVTDFIYRRFKENLGFLLNTEELASLFHFPLRFTETPNILWLAAKSAPASAELPNEGLLLGHNIYRGISSEVRIKAEDRRRHTYIVGKSGVGKSVLLANMAVQDILNGEGVCVLDPHGDLVSDILERIPPQRAEDVIIFSPADTDRPLGLNLLEFDPRYPEQKSFVINEMIGIFDKLYDLKSTGGPMFEQYMRNAMLLVMDDPDSGSTLMEIPKVLVDENFRRLKMERCQNQTVIDFWRDEAEKAGGEAALANIAPYVTSKLTSFISNDMMRPIIGQQKSSFNFRDLMDRQKILLVDLSKGIVGEMNAYLLGMIIVGKFLMAALSRGDLKSSERKDFYLYIDEFQNFTTDSIAQILSEARKYGLNLIIAHQYIGQLVKNNNSTIKDAVFGNVGTMVSFRVGSDDADYLVKEFSPVFNQFDLINTDKGIASIKLLVDNAALRPFSLKTIWPLLGKANPDLAEKIKSLSRLKYGQDRQLIETVIRQRQISSKTLQNPSNPLDL